MSGIYIHIPFCRQACYYCDFHFSVSWKRKDDFVQALLKEIELQKNFLANEKISSVYFGGGTPSILSADELKKILFTLSKYHSIADDAEMTLEANPDDLTKEKIKDIGETGINRLSIGIQSFSDEDLKFMNRVHDSKQAIESVKSAQDAGFRNITIDLIYGTPTLADEQWVKNLEQAFALDVPHLSCYALTVETQTALAQFIKKGKVAPVDEAKAAAQFEILMKRSSQKGFEQYEVSNFAKAQMYSRHNSSYWRNEKYLGLGPSAHSYNGVSRQWNVANNHLYIEAINKGSVPFEEEILTAVQKYNEYVLTSLRTRWGCDVMKIKNEFGEKFGEYFSKTADDFIRQQWMENRDRVYVLTHKGKFFADRISSDLFYSED
ncbi:MAG: radical SAM family heme chaperone HemW [Bacteroidetes bacterium]|nr:radical SAM family heme chaperone HemW [Bacteroidota bacterium]